MRKKRSYNDFPQWKDFQMYYPEAFRIVEGEEPAEEYWEWGDYSVHHRSIRSKRK